MIALFYYDSNASVVEFGPTPKLYSTSQCLFENTFFLGVGQPIVWDAKGKYFNSKLERAKACTMEHSTSPNADLSQGAEESDRLPEAAFPEEGFQYFDMLLPITAQMACHVPTHILDDVMHRHATSLYAAWCRREAIPHRVRHLVPHNWMLKAHGLTLSYCYVWLQHKQCLDLSASPDHVTNVSLLAALQRREQLAKPCLPFFTSSSFLKGSSPEVK